MWGEPCEYSIHQSEVCKNFLERGEYSFVWTLCVHVFDCNAALHFKQSLFAPRPSSVEREEMGLGNLLAAEGIRVGSGIVSMKDMKCFFSLPIFFFSYDFFLLRFFPFLSFFRAHSIFFLIQVRARISSYLP